MICPHWETVFNWPVKAHQKGKTAGLTHIEDNIFVGKTLVHKADYDNPDVVDSCASCWKPLQTVGDEIKL